MDPHKVNRKLWLALVLLALVALACRLSGAAETPTAQPTTSSGFEKGTPIADATRIPTPTSAGETPSPAAPDATDTPVPDEPGPGDCTLNSAYVADITVPDDTEFAPGAAFTKTWRVRNSGTCEWEAGTRLVWISGDPLGGPTDVEVSPTAPDANADISVDLVAPPDPGTYRSNWQLQSPDGTRFGNEFYVKIVVPEEPTETPTQEPTETPTEEPAPPDLVITNLSTDTDDPRQGKPLHIVATLRNQGASAAENVYWAWRVCVHSETCAFVEAPGPLTIGPGEEVVGSLEYTFGGWSTYTTEAWVDSREEIEESNEGNNRLQMVLPVKAAQPDLVITQIDYTPYPPVQNQNVAVKVTVKNQGSKDSGGFAVEWWSSTGAPDPRCTWNVSGGLVAGASVSLNCNYTYPSWYGKITTRANVDVGGTVAESNETNNTLDREIPVSKP